MANLIVVAVALGMFVAANIVGYRIAQPVSWWLFRRFHRTDLDALAFANQRWPPK